MSLVDDFRRGSIDHGRWRPLKCLALNNSPAGNNNQGKGYEGGDLHGPPIGIRVEYFSFGASCLSMSSVEF